MDNNLNIPRIGIIGRCDRSGLAIQSKEFFDNIPCKALVIDLTLMHVNNQNLSWYPNQTFVQIKYLGWNVIPVDVILEFIKDIDVLITFETPYDPNVFKLCREKGVKTILQLNYEFLEYPSNTLPKPDLFAAPSLWHYDEIPEPKMFLPVPVNTKHFTPIKKEKTFLHIVGKPAAYDRNGTVSLIESLKFIKNEVTIIIRSQYVVDVDIKQIPSNVKLIMDIENKKNYYDNYTGGVLIMPRRYAGLCLVINEALAMEMPCIMTDIEPNNFWLPKEWLVPSRKISQFRCKKLVDVYDADTGSLAKKIDEFCEHDYYEEAVRKAQVIKNRISWKTLLPLYLETFERLKNEEKLPQ